MELLGAAKLIQDFLQPVSDCGKRLAHVDKGNLQVAVLLHALPPKLADGKYHVNRPSACTEAALALREILLQVMQKAVELHTSQDLAW